MASVEPRVDKLEEGQERQENTLERIERKVDENGRRIDENGRRIHENGRRLDRLEGGSSQMSERVTSLDGRINTLTLVVFGTGATLAGLMITILARMG